MSQTLELIIRARDEASRQLGVIKDKFNGLNEVLGAAAIGFGGVVAAGKLAQKAYEDVLVPVMDYNRELKNMADATGMSIEEAARLTEVSEDLGIAQGELATAMQLATKNGFDPSLASIAALADEIAGMNDPSERAEYLSKLLGRNWAVLLPLLQDGGPAFLALAAAVDEGLIPTEQFVSDTEQLHIQVDHLNESMETTKNKILIDLIPAFLAGADAAADFLKKLGLINATGGINITLTSTGVPGGTVLSAYEKWKLGGHRAMGGEVGTGGDAYMVGEHGAERFTPNVPGTVTPTRDQLASSIDRMVKTLPTILIDAIERAK